MYISQAWILYFAEFCLVFHRWLCCPYLFTTQLNFSVQMCSGIGLDGISSFVTNIVKVGVKQRFMDIANPKSTNILLTELLIFCVPNCLRKVIAVCIHVLSLFLNTFLNDEPSNCGYEWSIIRDLLEHFNMTHSTLSILMSNFHK